MVCNDLIMFRALRLHDPSKQNICGRTRYQGGRCQQSKYVTKKREHTSVGGTRSGEKTSEDHQRVLNFTNVGNHPTTWPLIMDGRME